MLVLKQHENIPPTPAAIYQIYCISWVV